MIFLICQRKAKEKESPSVASVGGKRPFDPNIMNMFKRDKGEEAMLPEMRIELCERVCGML